MDQKIFKQYSNRSNAMRAIKKAGAKVGSYAIRNVEGSKAVLVVQVKPVATDDGYPADGKCPHCGLELSNGVGHHGQDVNGKKIKHKKFKFECLGCGEEFGPAIRKPAAKGVRGSQKGKVMPKGYHIEKVRETKNLVTRYSDGTIGSKIWAVLDKLPGGPKVVTAKQAAEACGKVGINATSATLGFYRWRRFHGQRGRVNLKKAQK